jgi:hypothetical protein
MAIIATTAFPSVITGADPSTLMQETLPYSQGCLSARGFVITDIGALYPSPDGLVLVSGNGVKVLTAKVLTKEQWTALSPAGKTHADLVSFYYDNIYIGFWQGTGHGFVFNFKDDPYITTFEVTDTIYHGCIDPTDDTLYLLTYDSPDYFAKAWESAELPDNLNLIATGESVTIEAGAQLFIADEYIIEGTGVLTINSSGLLAVCTAAEAFAALHLTNTLKSKIFTTPPTNFAFAKIIGDQSAGVPVTFKLFGNGSQVQHGGGNWSKSVQSIDMFRLPSGQRYESHEIEISGQAEVDSVILATSSGEIAQING